MQKTLTNMDSKMEPTSTKHHTKNVSKNLRKKSVTAIKKTCPGLRADVVPSRASVVPARADVVPHARASGQALCQRRGNGEPLGADVVPGEKRAL